MWERLGLASRVGFAYIGTVVGAGFASGQEILRFFTVFGEVGTWGIWLATVLFTWLGTRMMILGSRLQAHSYEELNHHLFGEKLGRWMTALVGIMLFGVTTTMMAGTGALFEEQLGLSFHLGVILTGVFTYLVMLRGMDGVLSVNAWVVPLLFFFILLVAVYAWQHRDWGWAAKWGSSASSSPLGLLSAVNYVALNLVLAQSVLVPLGAKIQNERLIRWGGWMGGIGLGFLLWACHSAMQMHWAEVSELKIPMAFVISMLGMGMKVFFVGMIWAEIFTTLVGNVYGLAAQVSQWAPFRLPTIMASILVLSYLCSLIGFSTLVRVVYPLFGYGGMVLLLMLIFRPLPKT